MCFMSRCCKAFVLVIILVEAGVVSGKNFMTNPAERKSDRPTELWRYYMHGVGDFFATPFEASFKSELMVREQIDTPYFKHDAAVVRLEPGTVIHSEALPIDLSSLKGKQLRIHYWMRGETVDRTPVRNSYSDAPQLLVVLRDDKGRQLSAITSHNGGVGNFPWHGYYQDTLISPRAASIHLRLRNSKSRQAWFGRFSWELIDESNSYSQNEKQEPETGSLAAFPWYEPINFHLFAKPPGTQHVWNFLRGPSAGMIGQPYDLTTLEGLRNYYRESVKVDLDQMNHGIMYFPMRYHQAKDANVLPKMEDGWLEEVGRLVIADQDPETGYWGTKWLPQSMSVTFHFIDMLFAFGIDRYDEAAKPDPKRCIAPTLPHPEQIVKTTFKLQSTYEAEGTKKLAAWNQAAYNFTDNPDASRSRCALGTSMNAIRMLRICRSFVKPETQREIDVSVKAAFRYIMDNCVNSDWLWTQQDIDTVTSKPAYFMNIINFSHYLEKRYDAQVPIPELSMEKTPDGIRICWRKWRDGQNSFRFYVTDDTRGGVDGLKTEMIVAIINRGEKRPTEVDPLIAVRNCVNAGEENWKLSIPWHSRIVREMKALNQQIMVRTASEEVLIPEKLIPQGHSLTATAVDWYGAESAPVEIYRSPGETIQP